MEIVSIHKSHNPELKRRFTRTPYSRKNWVQINQKINTFFNKVEDDYRLLHKPFTSTH